MTRDTKIVAAILAARAAGRGIGHAYTIVADRLTIPHIDVVTAWLRYDTAKYTKKVTS